MISKRLWKKIRSKISVTVDIVKLKISSITISLVTNDTDKLHVFC